jgi:hypothetical protein
MRDRAVQVDQRDGARHVCIASGRALAKRPAMATVMDIADLGILVLAKTVLLIVRRGNLPC